MGTNISSTIEYCPAQDLDTTSQTFAYSLSAVLSLIAVSGATGNALTIIAISLHKQLHKSYAAYVAHLACVDLLISAFLVPSNISGILESSLDGCEVLAAISLCCSVVSILNLMMIAVNRYVLICRERHVYMKLFSRSKIASSMVLMWLYALTVTLPLKALNGLGWSKKYHNCIFVSYQFDVYLYVVVCFSSVGLIIPICVTTISYILIIKKLRATAKRITPSHTIGVNPIAKARPGTLQDDDTEIPNATASTSVVHQDHPGMPQAPENQTPQLLNDRRLAKQKANRRRIFGLITVFMLFVICWLPLAATFMIDYKQTLPGWLNVSLMACAWMNSSVNVYLYAYTNQTFRHAFKCIIQCKFAEINKM